MKKLLVRIGIPAVVLACLALTLIAAKPASRPFALPYTDYSNITGNFQDLNVNNTITAQLPPLTDFINSVTANSVTDHNPDQITGVYVADKLAYPVVSQPENNPGFVSTTPDTVTQFGLAGKFNSIGLLAHNYLAGNSFYRIANGDLVTLVYGDGTTRTFWVYAISRYQALSPKDPYSDFINLDDPSKVLTSTDLFNKTYGMGVLVMQTCIQNGDESSWGRMFIMALPIDQTSEQDEIAAIPAAAFPLAFTISSPSLAPA